MIDNPFLLLGIDPSFEIDQNAIERAWLARSARLHPDRAPEHDEASDQLAKVNEAKATLADPERRAGALLTLLGGPDASQDKTLPDGFLESVLAERMAIDEAIKSAQQEQIKQLTADVNQREREIAQRVSALFCKAHTGDVEALTDIRHELNAWRYLARMRERLSGEDAFE